MKSRIIDIRGENASLYATFEQWWKAHKWPGVPLAMLPKCGVLVETEDGRGLAVGWLYMDNSVGVSWMEWVVTNPENTAKESFLSVAMLIQSLREVAASLDYGVMLTACRQPALVRLYEKNGFTKTDDNVSHLLMLTKG